jgi:tRNA-dihydrouridine synthase 1
MSHPPLTLLARRYLDIVEGLKTATANSAIRSHLFRLLKPELDRDESIRNKIAAARVPVSGNLDEFRAVLQEIDDKVKVGSTDKCGADDQPEQEALGPDWRPPPINPATGYRTLPSWVAQPYIRPTPVSTEVGGNEDFVSAAAATLDGSRPASPTPATNMSSPCVSTAPTACPSVAAMRCPTRACLTHCRQIRAVAQGMDPNDAAAKAASGELEGYGCEAHEEKFAAKRLKMQEKKKAQTEARRMKRVKNVEHKAAERAARVRKEERAARDGAKMEVDDEEAHFSMGM